MVHTSERGEEFHVFSISKFKIFRMTCIFHSGFGNAGKDHLIDYPSHAILRVILWTLESRMLVEVNPKVYCNKS